MKNVEVYTRPGCGFCVSAKQLLNNRGIKFTEHDISKDRDRYAEMLNRSTQRTFPQIFINNESIGGFTELFALDQRSSLSAD